MAGTRHYLEAARAIPAGETRTFLELAANAGHAGAARAAGRAIRGAAGDARVPGHRVVRADGRPWDDSGAQLAKLRREGARPRAGESVRAFAARTGARFIGRFRGRVLAAATAPEVDAWPGAEVEGFATSAAALARGFAAGQADLQPLFPRPAAHRSRQRTAQSIAARVRELDAGALQRALREQGYFHARALLTAGECAAVLDDAARPNRFERTIHMGPKGYGTGTYHYFREPLPAPLHELRQELYARLAPLAAEHRPHGYPATLRGFQAQCRRAGQRRASSIILCYATGGVNHPHRDLYGPEWFPFQAVVLLSRRGRDFTGGAFVLLEERADGCELRREIPATEGDVVVFASRHRLDRSGRRPRLAPLRHGMTPVTRGLRQAAGLVFHLAE